MPRSCAQGRYILHSHIQRAPPEEKSSLSEILTACCILCVTMMIVILFEDTTRSSILMWIWDQGARQFIHQQHLGSTAGPGDAASAAVPESSMRPLSDPSVHPIWPQLATSALRYHQFCLLRTPWCGRKPHYHTLHGKGWVFTAIPTRLRRSEVSMLPYMSSPSKTRADILQPSTSHSCGSMI